MVEPLTERRYLVPFKASRLPQVFTDVLIIGGGVAGMRAAIAAAGMTMAQFAIKWCLMNPGVTCVIPGGKNPQQVTDNSAASDFEPLTATQMQAGEAVYRKTVAPLVHHGW